MQYRTLVILIVCIAAVIASRVHQPAGQHR